MDCCNFCSNTMFISSKINKSIKALMPSASMPTGNYTTIITPFFRCLETRRERSGFLPVSSLKSVTTLVLVPGLYGRKERIAMIFQILKTQEIIGLNSLQPIEQWLF